LQLLKMGSSLIWALDSDWSKIWHWKRHFC
jgi:hypothetical protein